MNFKQLITFSLIILIVSLSISACGENKAQKEAKKLQTACEQFNKDFVDSCSKSCQKSCTETATKKKDQKLTAEQIIKVCTDSCKIRCTDLGVKFKPKQCSTTPKN